MSENTSRRPRATTVGLWVLRVALALLFVLAGASKLGGMPEQITLFDDVGAGQWLRYLVGACEVAGGIGLLVPRVAALAGLCLAALMAGATVANLTVLGDDPLVTVVLLLGAGFVGWVLLRRARPADHRVTVT